MVKDKVIYDIDEIKRISREIDAITGVIDDDKREELKLKYPGFRSLNMLIKSHNKKFGGNKPSVKNTNKKNHSKANFKSINKKNQSKANAEFKKKLGKINHFIDDDERIKLNPKNYENFNRLINIQNNGFIKKEQSEILKEFNSTLRKSTEIIDEKEIENFKIKYTKDYHDFFTSLNMEKSINKFNRDLKKKQNAEIVSILRNKYSSLNEPISKQAVSDLISKYPDGECGILIKKYNKQYFNNKYRKTEEDVFYLNDYIRKDDWDYFDSQRVNTSKEILKYKDRVSKFINKFTDEIIGFTEDFANYGVEDNIERIFLVSIPSSTAQRNKHSSMKKTIKIIEDNYKKGLIDCDKEIINFSDALVRVEDVKTAHMNTDDRPKYNDHIRTIKFNNEEKYDFENGVFLVLDDITTTGTIMRACGDILRTNNIEEDKIYKLVIAATK